jgi:ribosomal protein S17
VAAWKNEARVRRHGYDQRHDKLCHRAAESREEAAHMFENQPHFTIFPGDAVEIMECLPIPDSSQVRHRVPVTGFL